MKTSFKPRLEMLESRQALSTAAIVDGTSNTIMVGERAPAQGSAQPLPVLMVIANQDFAGGGGYFATAGGGAWKTSNGY